MSEVKPLIGEEPAQKERDLHGHLKNKQHELSRTRSGPPPGYGVIAAKTQAGEDFQLRDRIRLSKNMEHLRRAVTPTAIGESASGQFEPRPVETVSQCCQCQKCRYQKCLCQHKHKQYR